MKYIAFTNPYNDTSKKSLLLYDPEQELVDRIVEKVLERLSLTLDVSKVIQQIKELEKELDNFEKRFN